MTRTGFLVNPVGGGGRAWATWEALEPIVRTECEPILLRTERARDGVRLAREAAAAGCDRIIALGGDGTLNEAANGLAGTGVTLGIVPVGTGNDYARTLRIPTDPAEALRFALSAPGRPVDLGETDRGQLFLNIAGVGFDAEVVRRYHAAGRLRRAVGPHVRYWTAIAGAFAGFRGVPARLTLDDEAIDVPRLLMVAIGNAQFYGAGMHILPDAIVDDGRFDLAWGADLGPLELARLLRRIYKADHVGHPKVAFGRSAMVTVETARPVAYHLDGDLAGETPVTFHTRPGALRVAYT